MATPTLKQLWKRAPTSGGGQAGGGGGEGGGGQGAAAPITIDVDASTAMATKEPSQKKPLELDDSLPKPATASDASVTVVVVDDKVREVG